LLPLIASSILEEGLVAARDTQAVRLVSTASDRLHCSAHWRRDAYRIRIVTGTAFDPVAGREEGVEALNEVRVAGEEL
jgi:hypothetical protein